MRFLDRLKLLVLVIIPPLCFSLMSQNVFAESTYISQYGVYGSESNVYPNLQCQAYNYEEGFHVNDQFARCAITAFLIETGDVTVTGNTLVITSKVNLVVFSSTNEWRYLDQLKILGLSLKWTGGSAVVTPTSSSYQYFVTPWTDGEFGEEKKITLTVTFNATGSIPSSANGKTVNVRALFGKSANYAGSSQADAIWYGGSHLFYFEDAGAATIVNFANSATEGNQQAVVDALSIMQAQNTVINNNIQNINNAVDEHYQKEDQAISNIDNQSSSDVEGSESQQTTNLIGVLSSFLTQLQGFSATNCNLSLPFPEFIGGTQNVNICQGKDVLGNFITVIGTLAMVTFYIPLAIVLLKMIYNEIRSFTNG